MLYQCKIGLFLFAIIATKLDIIFAISYLSKFNQQQEPQYHKAANQVFYYLFLMQNYYIHY